MTTYTDQQIINAARDIVADKGDDYVYPNFLDGCTYTEEDDSPSCIVGHIVSRLDPTAFQNIVGQEMRSGDEKYERLKNTFAAEALNSIAGTEFTYIQLAALSAAQGNQDSGSTWGGALKSLVGELGGER